MHGLSRLVYISDFDNQNLSSDTITHILASAKKNNAEMGITGMLLFDYNHFLQVLEGPSEAVDKLYAVIQQDSRHSNVRTIENAPAHTRLFSYWNMGFAHLDKAISNYIDMDDIDADSIIHLCQLEAAKKTNANPPSTKSG